MALPFLGTYRSQIFPEEVIRATAEDEEVVKNYYFERKWCSRS